MKSIKHGDTVSTAKIKELLKSRTPFFVELTRIKLIFSLDFRRAHTVGALLAVVNLFLLHTIPLCVMCTALRVLRELAIGLG